jgi:hypothetical protein
MLFNIVLLLTNHFDRPVVSRLIHSSSWPIALGADSASRTGVSRRIQALSWIQRIALVLVAIAAVVTPLGLYDQLSLGDTSGKTA